MTSCSRPHLIRVTALIALAVALASPGSLAAPKEIRIGAIYPLTGGQAPTGHDAKAAVELAQEIINGQYNLNLPLAKTSGLPNLGGAKVRFVFGDSQSSPEKGMSEAERLITGEKVIALLGCYNSNVTAPASQVAERFKIPFVNPDSTSPILNKRGLKWFFRTTPDDETFVENFFQFFDDLKERGVKIETIASVCQNALSGVDNAKLIRRFAQDHKYKLVEEQLFTPNSADLSSEIQRLKASKPDVLIVHAEIADAVLMTKQLKEMDFSPDAVVASAAGFVVAEYLGTLGRQADYIISREVFSLDFAEKKPIVKAVNDLYKKRYGKDMNGHNARVFMGALVLADAINRAKSTDPEAVRQALSTTSIPADQIIMPWKGIKFDATGQNTLGNGILVQVQKGVYRTVWPWDVATVDLVWPAPAWKNRK